MNIFDGKTMFNLWGIPLGFPTNYKHCLPIKNIHFSKKIFFLLYIILHYLSKFRIKIAQKKPHVWRPLSGGYY